MNGPEHYQEAEKLLDAAIRYRPGTEPAEAQVDVALAQVHATLALAAAVGTLDAYQGPINGYSLGRSDSDAAAWQSATGGSDD